MQRKTEQITGIDCKTFIIDWARVFPGFEGAQAQDNDPLAHVGRGRHVSTPKAVTVCNPPMLTRPSDSRAPFNASL